MFLAGRCLGCRTGPRRGAICRRCQDQLGTPLGPVEPPPGIDSLLALYRYDPIARRLILAAKNGGERQLLVAWSRLLAQLVADTKVATAAEQGPVVTWIPATRSGARRRGYDQGRVLARGLVAHSSLQARRLLVRRRQPGQAGANRAARLQGPALRTPIGCPPHVVLVDDVVTTGASLSAGADALRAAGARSVTAVVVAVAGDRRPRPQSGREMGVSLTKGRD